MKSTFIIPLVLPTAGFIAAAVAHAAGVLEFDVLTPAGVIGALVGAAVLGFLCADYSQKRAFRVRRPDSIDASTDERIGSIPPPDWTYSIR